MDNIIKTPTSTIILNGGNPLPGCPESYDQAHDWADDKNKDKNNYEPRWGFDCGFKLDFDGPLFDVCCRFYPPKSHYGPKWDGTVSIYTKGYDSENENPLLEKRFEEDTLEELRQVVEMFVDGIRSKLLPALLQIGIRDKEMSDEYTINDCE